MPSDNEEKVTPEESREFIVKSLTAVFEGQTPILTDDCKLGDLGQAKLLIHELACLLNQITLHPLIQMVLPQVAMEAAELAASVSHAVSCPHTTIYDPDAEEETEAPTWQPSNLPFQNPLP